MKPDFLPRSTFSFLALLSLSASAAPRIAEFVADNRNSLVDGDGKSSDWIEIHHPDGETLDLTGYHLTDDPGTPTKYTFPAGTTIPSGGTIVVFASNQNDGNYSDGNGSLHTNFSLDASGDYLSLNLPGGEIIQEFSPGFPKQFEDVSYGIVNAAPTETLVEPGFPSKWFVPGSDIGTAWRDLGFIDANWASANTGIGYSNNYQDFIGAGGNTQNAMWFINSSVYLRIPFQVDDPSQISSLTLRMRYEDGFAAYLNGVPVASANAPAEEDLTHTSTATTTHPDTQAITPEDFSFSAKALVEGTNVLSFQGLNLSKSASNSNDFLLQPELLASGSSTSIVTGYFDTPTPGLPNSSALLSDYVRDTKFSVKRGYHSEPFDLTITTSTEDDTIIYTLNGTSPSIDNGVTYTGPIPIGESSTIRVIAMKDEFLPTNIDTQTYLFVSDIIQQTRPAGYPTTWGGGNADYDMDPDVVNDPDYANEFEEAFAALPTLSLVFDPDAFFHPTTGIYQRPQSEGIAWERPTSAELIVPGGFESGFQIDAGVRIQGGSSRSTDTPKHSLSLRFRSDYGSAKLKYPLFENSPEGGSAVGEFDTLQLRPEYNFGWMHRHWYQCDHALYGRDQWASDLFLKMGQNGSHGRWVHLFLNGIYWGLYDLHERPDADHMANYFGGKDDDYDTVNSSVATNGDLNAYNAMMNLAYGSIQTEATYAAIQDYLDLDAFIDYLMLNAYVGNRDWDGHNWRAARKRETGAPFLFFPWDTEFAASHVSGGSFPTPPNFFTTALNTNVTGKNRNRRPTGLQQRLALNPEYRMRYADRVRAHLFNGGPLSPEVSAETWTTRAIAMSDAIVAESARWGDFRRDVNSGRWTSSQFDLYTRDDHYSPMNDWLVNTYIPQRTGIVLGQLESRNLYPTTNAPDFSLHGGRVPRGTEVQINAPSTIYYTIDGSDPREPGGAVSPSAVSIAPNGMLPMNSSTLLRARTRAGGGQWSALTEATFTVGAGDLIISEIMYRPAENSQAEFLEIYNANSFEISLTGLHFTEGIVFNFDDHSSLNSLSASGRLLIVRDLEAFQAVHGNTLDSIIAGIFQEGTALSNDGEVLTLADAAGTEIFSMTYNDTAPWSGEADGDGPSLVFRGGIPKAPESWRVSATNDGNPGTTDSTSYADGPLTTYALAEPLTLLGDDSAGTASFRAWLTADDVDFTVEYSANLETWAPIASAPRSQIANADGSRTVSFKVPPGQKGFLRLFITLR